MRWTRWIDLSSLSFKIAFQICLCWITSQLFLFILCSHQLWSAILTITSFSFSLLSFPTMLCCLSPSWNHILSLLAFSWVIKNLTYIDSILAIFRVRTIFQQLNKVESFPTITTLDNLSHHDGISLLLRRPDRFYSFAEVLLQNNLCMKKAI